MRFTLIGSKLAQRRYGRCSHCTENTSVDWQGLDAGIRCGRRQLLRSLSFYLACLLFPQLPRWQEQPEFVCSLMKIGESPVVLTYSWRRERVCLIHRKAF